MRDTQKTYLNPLSHDFLRETICHEDDQWVRFVFSEEVSSTPDSAILAVFAGSAEAAEIRFIGFEASAFIFGWESEFESWKGFDQMRGLRGGGQLEAGGAGGEIGSGE